ncbi:MAG TPA: DEAD/DEAH box helicase [Desulfomicrobiaceae bacterium]|nr:DEAD/DEAH box helicase [Desulfomicrobiaceae bacterium]
MNFSSLGLSAPLLKAVAELGHEQPYPVQESVIPAVLDGRDVLAQAQTGTGKTAAFALPVLELLIRGRRVRPNQARALILAPTRELAVQIEERVREYGRYLPVRSTVVFGGVKINPQMMRLRKGTDILVATPGRLLDLCRKNAVGFRQLELLILDEADRMLDMGFLEELQNILALLPEQRQTLMFSATFSDTVRALAGKLVRNPVEISVNPEQTSAETVHELVLPMDTKQKAPLLVHLMRTEGWTQVLVFCKTKEGVNRLARYLDKKRFSTATIHGDKSQGARARALEDFKTGSAQVLVATDLAARGLDIEQLPVVINFELPKVSENYVHRIGRTGRAGLPGRAVSLVSAEEFTLLTSIERLLRTVLPRQAVEGFEPTRPLPESRLDLRPIRPKKPKKNKKSDPR